MRQFSQESVKELQSLCDIVRRLMRNKAYERCREVISAAIGKYPDAPEPHNLLGIILEKEGNYISAMKHFRAAWALDPTYIPVRHNLHRFSSLHLKDKCAFDESDCQPINECSATQTIKHIGGRLNEAVLEK